MFKLSCDYCFGLLTWRHYLSFSKEMYFQLMCQRCVFSCIQSWPDVNIFTPSPLQLKVAMSLCILRCPWCSPPSRQVTRAHRPASQRPVLCLALSPIWTQPSCLPLLAPSMQRTKSPLLTTGESWKSAWFCCMHTQVCQHITKSTSTRLDWSLKSSLPLSFIWNWQDDILAG